MVAESYVVEVAVVDRVSDPERLAALYELLALAVVRRNVAWLRRRKAAGLPVPRDVASSGLRYVPYHGTARGRRRSVLTAPVLMERAAGTCFDLACLEAACVREAGGTASVRVPASADGMMHALVAIGNGRVVDVTTDLEVAP